MCRGDTIICVLDAGTYEVGDDPPEGYNAWHEWASVQHKGGLRQERCCRCSLYRFPQEMSGEFDEWEAETAGGVKVQMRSPVCKKCKATQ